MKDDDDEHTIDIGGLPVTVTSMDECAKAAYLVCTPAWMFSPFTDNVITPCCLCGCDVQARPYWPPGPKRICLDCFPKVVQPA